MSDYLWDKSGTPDPEVERLETLLEQFRYRPGSVRGPRPRFPWRVLAAAAALIVAVTVWQVFRMRSQAWTVSLVESGGGARSVRLGAGQTLVTAMGETAHMSMPRVGRLDVDPETTLRVVRSRSNEQRFELLRGTIHAHIGAPPRVFVVNTPSATATDLGCTYTLHVDPSGDGMLRVTSGLIEFDWNARRALVPTGAVAMTRAGAGPGTPFFEDAAPEFRRALATWDITGDDTLLRTVLASARPRDAVTLLNLVQTVRAAERGLVLARLAQLAPPPAGVDTNAILAGHFESLQPWWNQLGLRHHPAVRLF